MSLSSVYETLFIVWMWFTDSMQFVVMGVEG